MLWFNVIRGSNFIFLCFKLINTHYHTQKQKKIKSKSKDKIEPQHIQAESINFKSLPLQGLLGLGID